MDAYIAALLCMGAAYAILTIGYNLHWGYTGLFNLAVFGLAAAGGYTSVILTTPAAGGHIGGFGMPYIVGILAGAVVAGILGAAIGTVTLRLEFGFFAIATLGLGKFVIAVFKNEKWMTNGVWGIGGIPKPLSGVVGSNFANWAYGGISVLILIVVYFLVQKLVTSPWGRVQMAIKDDEHLTQMLGKNAWRYRMESLVIGSMLMGLGGAVYAHYQGYINPKSYTDIMWAFLPLLMVVGGGSGNNRGSILGAFVIWGAWSISEIFAGYLPIASMKIPHIRTLAVGLLIIAILRWRPSGLIGRKRAVSSSAATEE